MQQLPTILTAQCPQEAQETQARGPEQDSTRPSHLTLQHSAPATAPTLCSQAWSDSPRLGPQSPASRLTATAAGTPPSGCPPRGSCPVGALPPVRYRFETCHPPSSPACPW
ncbi:pecanex 1 [Phyllostomus discolor]|uniref:Pecanex 1 n=1 Tax=Phyllostomus discolor TaxID=89673 RepID=A0A834BJG9_9CHIR|nr:pecanex 1 [Phyllostomus discolor]